MTHAAPDPGLRVVVGSRWRNRRSQQVSTVTDVRPVVTSLGTHTIFVYYKSEIGSKNSGWIGYFLDHYDPELGL